MKTQNIMHPITPYKYNYTISNYGSMSIYNLSHFLQFYTLILLLSFYSFIINHDLSPHVVGLTCARTVQTTFCILERQFTIV